jgi:acyl-ACP thioesterase
VRPSDLDPLDHVNNAVYLDWLEEALAAAGWSPTTATLPMSRRLEYLASAERGDSVVVELHGEHRDWNARIRRENGADLVRARSAATA